MKLGFLSTIQSVGTLTTKIAIVAAASIGGTALVSSSVFATLTATATNTSGAIVTSGNMSLTQAQGLTSGSGSAAITSGGFVTTISNMAPQDVVNRLITLTNGGSINAASMTVAVTDTSATVLTTGSAGFTGLTAEIKQCSIAWAQATAGGLFTCGATETTVKSSATILSMATPSALSVQSQTLLATGVAYLKIAITLPDFTETTLNGAVPGAGSIQSKSASLNWSIVATQRTQTTTNS